MKLDGIKNIIFDLGGVLLNLDFSKTQQAFVDLGVVDFDKYYTKAQQTGIFDLYETGRLTETEFCNGLRSLTQLKFSNQEVINAWNAMLLDFPPVRKQLLLELKQHYNVSLLSNTNETHIKAFNKTIKKDIDEASLAPLFHSYYFSNDIGYRKPNKDAFEYVLNQNNYKAEETLFLDDSIQHIEGARQVGIKTIQIIDNPVEKLFANFLA